MKSRKLLIAGVIFATVALLAMLAYNFRHTGQLLARHVDPPGYGYGAAAGIELGVLVLAVAIGTRKWHGLKTRWLEAVLVFVLAVSFLANVAEGHLERYGTDITSVTMTNIDWVQGLISLAATGLISVIVMAMSEIIGQYIVQLAGTGEETQESGLASPHRSSNGTGKMEKARQLLFDHPDSPVYGQPCGPVCIGAQRYSVRVVER